MRRHLVAWAARLCPAVAVFLVLSTIALSHSARGENLTTIESQLTAMQTVLNELDTHYGMLEFKDETFNVGLDFLRKKYGRLIRDAQTVEESLGWQPQVYRKILPPEEFRQLMIAMIAELRDGHVNITRLSHSVYSLGLFTAMIDSHLYVTGFHKDLFVPTGASRQILEGDEVIAVNGRSISDITRENLLYIQDGTFESRSISAMEYALVRPNGIFRKLKEGDSVEVRFRRKDETFTAHLNWINVAGLRYTRSMYPKSFDLTHVRAANENLPAPFGARGTVRSYFLQGLMANGGWALAPL